MYCVFISVCGCLCRTLHVNVVTEAKLAVNDDEAKAEATKVTDKLRRVLEKVRVSVSQKKPVDGLEKDANELATMHPARVLQTINHIKDLDSATGAMAAALEGDLSELRKHLEEEGDPCENVASWLEGLWKSKEEDSDYPDLSVEDESSVEHSQLELFSHWVCLVFICLHLTLCFSVCDVFLNSLLQIFGHVFRSACRGYKEQR
jgi:hypothetical protein